MACSPSPRNLDDIVLDAAIALEIIPFAPREPQHQDALIRAMLQFADNPEGLAWTVQQAVAKWHKWLGIAELRAIYCTRFKPADGIEMDVLETPGLTPSDNETAYLLEQAKETDRKLAEWRKAAALLPPAEQEANQELLAQVERAPRKVPEGACVKCGGTGTLEIGYCDCQMGRDLKSALVRPRAAKIREVKTAAILKSLDPAARMP